MNSRRMSSNSLIAGNIGSDNGNNSNALRSESRTASIASSETSETQSISDEWAATNARKVSNKGTKKPKEAERPPWRATISVAAPKVDKNAMLRAKLLEASRRIARASRMPSVGVQTDKPPTKLVREVSIGIQKDLIPLEDKECLTDGVITVKDKSGNLILTHSVSQLTDAIVTRDSQTQTALPRNSVRFNKNIIKNSQTTFKELKQNDQLLREQKKELLKIDEKLNSNAEFNYDNIRAKNVPETKNNFTYDNINLNDARSDVNWSDVDTDSISDNESAPSTSNKKRLNTHTSWHNIDFSSDEDDYPQFPRRYMTRGKNTWCDFKDLVMGQRLAKMRLSPILTRRTRSNLKRVTWSDTQHRIVSNLVNEANALMEMFDQVSMLLGPDIKLNDIPNLGDNVLPPFEMDSALTKSCDLLEHKINQIKPITFREPKPLPEEYLEYENYDLKTNNNNDNNIV